MPLPEFEDRYADFPVLDTALYRDMAWVIVTIGVTCLQSLDSDVDLEGLKPVGSWTAFMKDTSATNTEKCKLEYLPVIPFPPGENIVKYYLDMIVDLAEELELNHLFC